MSSDTDDDASELKEFDYTAYRNLYTYHAHTLSKTLHRSRESQARLREFRNLAPKTEIQIFENSEILVASEDVTSSEIVLELNGLVGTIRDRIERTPTLFRSDLMDTPLLILTSTGFHGPAYAIRRSAHPNCHLEHVICHLEPIAWILKANKSIPRGTEITVASDFPPERGTVDRPRPEVIGRRTVDGYVNVKARQPPSPTSSESESPDANTTTSGSSESFTSSDSPSVCPRVPMSAPLKRIRTENGWKTLPAKEKILKKSTSSEIPKKKKKKSGGRWGAGWTAKTRKRKVGGAKTTVSPKIRKLDSETIVTSSESNSGNSTSSNAVLTSSDSSKVKNSEATSSESSKIVYSLLTSSESQKMNSENINPNLTSSEAQKIDNVDFENSEFQKMTSSDSDETQKLEKSVCPRVPMSAPLKRIRTENGWKTLPAKEKKIPPKIDNPQKSINQKKKKKPRRQPWSSGGGRKKKMGFALKKKTVITSSESEKLVFGDSESIVMSSNATEVNLEDSEVSGVVVTSSEAPDDEIEDSKGSGNVVTSSKPPEAEKSIVMSSEALPTSSETGEFDIEYSGEPGTRLTSPESRNSDSEAPEALLTPSKSQNVENHDSGALLVTSSETPEVKFLDSKAPEALLASSDAPDVKIDYEKDSEAIVTYSKSPEVEKTIVMSSEAPATSSETGEFEMEDFGALRTSSNPPVIKNLDSEAPEALLTSSEFQNVENRDSGALVTYSKHPDVNLENSEASGVAVTSSETGEFEMGDSGAFVASYENQKVRNLDSEALEEDLTSSESQKFKIRDSESPEALTTSSETPEGKIENLKALEVFLTSSESKKLENQDTEYPEDVVKIEDDSDVSMEFGEAADLLIFAENEEMSNVTSSGVPGEDSDLTTTTSEIFQNILLTFSPEIPEILDSEDVTSSEIRKHSQILADSGATSSENYVNTYSEDVSALLKTWLKQSQKTTPKIKNYLLQDLKIRKFRKIQNPEYPNDIKLMTSSTVAPGDIILELIGHVAFLTEVPEAERTGKWMYTADFLTKNAQNSVFGDHRYTKSIFCIDPINECRFLRRSCKPNAHFDHFIDSEDVLRIIVTPTHSILRNSEITLKFDWDFAINSKEPLVCALHQFNMSNCPVERQRMSRMFHLAMERVRGVEPPSISTVNYSNPNSRPQFLEEHNYRSLSDGPKDVDRMVKSMKCDRCDLYSTNRKWNLLKHLQGVHNASPEDLAKIKKLFKGRKSVYSMGNSWKCELCHLFSTNRKTNLYQHLRGVHKASPEDVARVKEALKDHRSVDSMGKPWKCDRCDVYWTKRKSNLYEHLRGVHKASPEDVTRVQKALKKKKAPNGDVKETSSAPLSTSSAPSSSSLDK